MGGSFLVMLYLNVTENWQVRKSNDPYALATVFQFLH